MGRKAKSSSRIDSDDVWGSDLFKGDAPKIVLMGDSVLDNFYWLENRSMDLRNVIDEKLQGRAELANHRCLNLAVDQMSSFDLSDRRPHKNGWSQYERARHYVFQDSRELADRTYTHLQDANGNIRSIHNLSRLQNVRCVVVSVGGNDVYLDAAVQVALVKSINPFQRHLREQVGQQFRERLEEIFLEFDGVMPSDSFLLPVIVYHPHHGFSISGLNSGCGGFLAKGAQKLFLSGLVTPMARQFLEIAQKRSLPVLDLSRTFNPHDVTHYGTMDMEGTENVNWSGAEPSDTSQRFIADLVLHVFRTWTRDKGSIVYSGVVNHSGREGRIVQVRQDLNEGSYPASYVFSVGSGSTHDAKSSVVPLTN